MVIAPLSLRKDYWEDFEVTERDLEYLYNYLLEEEQPQTPDQLMHALVSERIRQEKDALEKQQASGGATYYPKDHYQVGQQIRFPSLGWETGKVTAVRSGQNPELPPFEVIDVQLATGEARQYAAGLEQHKLNQPVSINADDPLLEPGYVLKKYGGELSAHLSDYLESNEDLVRIAGMYFPRALLVDINPGHLNLAEAVLDMMGGGPLPTPALMDQIDLPEDVDSKLNEFSLNLALQEDKRFDEVGPSGEVLWYLHRLEPEPVREAPIYLRYSGHDEESAGIEDLFQQFETQVVDELDPGLNPPDQTPVDEATISLIYPHWRAGTLPLAGNLTRLFPTALESPRIQFTFVDGNTHQKFSGWVVRPLHYVYGLREWYLSQGIITGSLIHIQRGSNPEEVIIRADKKRAVRDWIRTAIVGSDGGVVFSMLKHNISSAIDERMAIMISDTEMLDKVWEQNTKKRVPLASTVRVIMAEMAKLSPQSHVHAQELYAGINILRRCPPGAILKTLLESDWARHLGNLYFRLEDASGGDDE
jgi:hypothetical protein